eukprot:CAMPEP_0203856208 /NCGR_PEP_ID=MMETSP0359-20131031/10052_1 /ASSEMBLY_ACC=CAM_ASM_000338 /TAXON_ID=268821 /ORGANISM="Scrippsiella Hangoei, Strain SHTV-5" /LENGTH=215 /DNA_ID=CAMNT_0050772801 /DNA_START=96 /DNA_END=742 /DNA_ORIENTATION=-
MADHNCKPAIPDAILDAAAIHAVPAPQRYGGSSAGSVVPLTTAMYNDSASGAALQRAMVLTVYVQQQCGQINDLQLIRQSHVAAGVYLKYTELKCIASSLLFVCAPLQQRQHVAEGSTTSATRSSETNQSHLGLGQASVVRERIQQRCTRICRSFRTASSPPNNNPKTAPTKHNRVVRVTRDIADPSLEWRPPPRREKWHGNLGSLRYRAHEARK